MNSLEIRKKFLNFFEKNGHTIVTSSSLIPAQDPTLLFTNAGMNQFKDIFLGKEKRSYTKATSIQKCVRAGGKHNDLDQVGFTARHLTYFEMMGNFSFGDYFKKEAIHFAWEFLTKEVGLAKEKLYVTVYKKDDDAYDIWNKVIGLDQTRIGRLGEKDNFWQMGDTGPCGPCTEIYFDLGESLGCGQENCAPGCDCPRFIEIWNLVFMQYNRQPDGELKPLEKTGVDTGMGLERLCLVMQNAPTVFDTDIFSTLIEKIGQISKIAYSSSNDQTKAAFRVMVDHTRSISLIIADGGNPSNEGRGYVLRKIIRRAALFSQKLTPNPKLLSILAQEFINQTSEIYPELKTSETLIINIIENELSRFQQNLITGQEILNDYAQDLRSEGKDVIPGSIVFKLYDTYGFPPELTALIAQEKNFSIDMNGFDEEMKKQQTQSGKKAKTSTASIEIPQNLSTKFVGYENLESDAKILFAHDIDENTAIIVLDKSPFYVESGGQISDGGCIKINNSTYEVIDLNKVDKNENCAVSITIKSSDFIKNKISENETVHCIVDAEKRANIANNHTATHLLQAALIKILGSHVKQAGSVVQEDHLRFDFTHHQGLSDLQITQVEELVNQKIRAAIQTNTAKTTLQQAKDAGALSFFGEKYNPENVRMVSIPGISTELCGGTHTNNTGSIGVFKIISETALATGTRRIVATTGKHALSLFQQCFSTTKKISEDFKVKVAESYNAVQKLQQNYQEALGKIKLLKKQTLKGQIPLWLEKITLIDNVPFLYIEADDISTEELKQVSQEIEKTTPGFYFLLSKEGPERFNFLAYASKTYQTRVNLTDLAKQLKDKLNMRGGGNSQTIQGSTTQKPLNFFEFINNWLKNK